MEIDDEKIKAMLAEAERDRDHYTAFGRFIASYALAEAFVNCATRYFSGTNDHAARIIFGGMRLGDLAERIRALTRQQDAIYSEIDSCLTQLEKIAKVRHRLVHRTITRLPYVDGLRVSNSLIAKSLSYAEEETVEIKTLEDMGFDCVLITVTLTYLMSPDLADEAATFRRTHGAWRYKPPPPKPKAHRGIPR